MKKIVLLVFSIFLLASFSFAQNASWEYNKDFKSLNTPNAIVKDKDGNIWYASKTADAGLNIVKFDGTPLSFSPINSVTVGGTTVNTKTGCMGLQLDLDGNILGIFNGNDLVRINAKTGAGMTYKQIPAIGSNKDLSDFGIDTLGNIYFTHVTQPAPIEAYTKDFVKIKDVVPTRATDAPVCKAVTVTNKADWPESGRGGIQIYAGLSDGGSGIFHYRAYEMDSTFLIVDTLLKGRKNVESFNWDPNSPLNCWISFGGTEKKLQKIKLGADYKASHPSSDEISMTQLSSPRGIVINAKSDSCIIPDYANNKLLLVTLQPFQQFKNWEFKGIIINLYNHGVAVDPDGKIWVCGYNGTDNVHVPGKNINPVFVINPDGTIKDTVWRVTVKGITDTLVSSNRGVSTDYQGNILLSNYDALYKINYKTYEGMAKVFPKKGASITQAGSDQYGNIAVGNVATDAIITYDKDFNLLGPVIAKSQMVNGFSRVTLISASGNDIYIGCTDGLGIANYHSDNGIYGPFTFSRYVGSYTSSAQSIGLDSKGNLWVGSDDFKRFDCWDLTTTKIIDGINAVPPANPAAPVAADALNGYFGLAGGDVRGIAFSPDGKTAYTAQFSGKVVQKWQKIGTGINDKFNIPEKFEISQNYPNPFNPTTNIKFSVPKATNINITIYDIFGREVFKLLDNVKYNAGTYNVTWTGRNTAGYQVATGTYFYRVQAGSYDKTMKMMLIK